MVFGNRWIMPNYVSNDCEEIIYNTYILLQLRLTPWLQNLASFSLSHIVLRFLRNVFLYIQTIMTTSPFPNEFKCPSGVIRTSYATLILTLSLRCMSLIPTLTMLRSRGRPRHSTICWRLRPADPSYKAARMNPTPAGEKATLPLSTYCWRIRVPRSFTTSAMISTARRGGSRGSRWRCSQGWW